MIRLLTTLILTVLYGTMSLNAHGEVQPVKLRLYLDADFTNSVSSSLSIEQGILTALSETGNTLGGHPVELVRKNHRGNSNRSFDNLQDYLEDNSALAVFSGLHSPPLLANREFINTNDILVLSPWAAASPITRYPSGTNWIFRLSIDDSKAGYAMVKQGIINNKLSSPALMLEKTGWGEANLQTIQKALQDHGLKDAGVYRFNWGLSDFSARMMIRQILKSQADSILLVANTPEAIVICRALIELQMPRIFPVISHWGITGGNFPQEIPPEARQKLDLSFLQTTFSFLGGPQSTLAKEVAAKIPNLFPGQMQDVADIQAPAGFIHGFDLTRLLIAAAEQANITGTIEEDRRSIRDALENLQTPVEGLIKTYRRPFRPYSPADPDAHEALGRDELVLGRYNSDNLIILEKEK